MNKENLEKIRHSLSHLMTMAVLEIYPEAKLGVGPVIENGFYQDYDLPEKISEDIFPKLEKRMRELIKEKIDFKQKELDVKEALSIYKDDPYKTELIKELADKGEKKVSFYDSGDFSNLCAGPHIKNTKEINPESFKLSRIAGAYWRGSEDNKMLTRIYGLAFEDKKALVEYEKQMEEAEKRDHRKIGKELEIFSFDDDVGPGLPLWLPNGGAMIEELEKLAKEKEFEGGYVRVKTPHLAKESMYLLSGHLPYYKESMYPPMEYEGGKYYLKAMNCPHHHKIYGTKSRSYRDLPLRLAEYGTCYRHEKSGELFGLMRVRSMQMNDAHIYCTKEQFANEFKKVVDLYLEYFRIFGITKYVMRLSTHDPKRLGDKYVNEPKLWIETEKMVRDTMTSAKIDFIEVPNEAAFYGPKIDVQVWSAIGKEFTLATNQVDFAVPKRFGLVYTNEEGKVETPLCIHRAPLSTHERMIGFLIEHYAGNFPLWLSPVQVKIIPIRENHLSVAKKVHQKLFALGIRAELADGNENFGKKVREAKTKKIPYFVIIGDKDIEAGKVTLESRDKGNLGQITQDELVSKLATEIKERK